MNQYFRIKVLIDVSQPLKRGFVALDDQGRKTWYQVTYERLPMFCFLCGILGHGESHCPTRYEEDFREPEEGFQFGNWLRASPHDTTETGAPLPLQPVDTRLTANTHPNAARKRGSAVFAVGRRMCRHWKRLVVCRGAIVLKAVVDGLTR